MPNGTMALGGAVARKNGVDETLRREAIKARLAEAQSALIRLPRGSTA